MSRKKFDIERSQIRPAVEAMIAEADAIARCGAEYGTIGRCIRDR